MPIPVLAGIPWLAGVLGALFTTIFTWAATLLTKRFAVVAAAVIVLGAITVALFAALQALITGLGVVVPTWMSQAAAHALPSNTSACVTAYWAARLARYAYDWNVRIIQYKLF